MSIGYSDWVQSGVYDSPAISFPAVGTYTQTTISLHLTSLKPATRNAKLSQAALLPTWGVDPNDARLFSNSVSGGFVIGQGSLDLPKLDMEGWTDTPTSPSNGMQLPTLQVNTPTGQQYLTYGELIALYIEGFMNVSISDRRTIQPLWFRDHSGRQYNNPKITAYTGSFVEAVPGRVQFQMSLTL